MARTAAKPVACALEGCQRSYKDVRSMRAHWNSNHADKHGFLAKSQVAIAKAQQKGGADDGEGTAPIVRQDDVVGQPAGGGGLHIPKYVTFAGVDVPVCDSYPAYIKADVLLAAMDGHKTIRRLQEAMERSSDLCKVLQTQISDSNVGESSFRSVYAECTPDEAADFMGNTKALWLSVGTSRQGRVHWFHVDAAILISGRWSTNVAAEQLKTYRRLVTGDLELVGDLVERHQRATGRVALAQVVSAPAGEEAKQPNDLNPVAALVAMPSDFFGRVTPDGLISIYDAIQYSRPNCNPRDVFRHLDLEKFLSRRSIDAISKFSFRDALGRVRWTRDSNGERVMETVPVAPFNVVKRILMEVGGEFGNALKSAANEVHTRVLAGDVDLERFVAQRRAEIPPDVADVVMAGLKRSKEALDDSERECKRLKKEKGEVETAKEEADGRIGNLEQALQAKTHENKVLKEKAIVVFERLAQVDLSTGQLNSFPLRIASVWGITGATSGDKDARIQEIMRTAWNNAGKVITTAGTELHLTSKSLRSVIADIMGVANTDNEDIKTSLMRVRRNNHITNAIAMQGIFKRLHPGVELSTKAPLELILPYLRSVNDWLEIDPSTRCYILPQVRDMEWIVSARDNGMRHPMQGQRKIVCFFAPVANRIQYHDEDALCSSAN
jgi:hypothetical protein